jgi:hypothetical protein
MNNLHNSTLQLLSNTTIPLQEIAKETRVGYRWLCDFKNGRFTDPGVNKTERLYRFLTGQSINHDVLQSQELLPKAFDCDCQKAA